MPHAREAPELHLGQARDRLGPAERLLDARAFALALRQLACRVVLPSSSKLAAPERTLEVDPILPDWLPEITLSNLRVGHSTIALRFTGAARRLPSRSWTTLTA
jgi:hypothetical protein